jgi:hypothetical protein
MRVTVSGNVDSILSPHAVTLEDNDLLFGEQLLILTTRPMLDDQGRLLSSAQVNRLRDQRVTVTGTANQFRIADFRASHGIDLNQQMFAQWEGKPALVASSIRFTDRDR